MGSERRRPAKRPRAEEEEVDKLAAAPKVEAVEGQQVEEDAGPSPSSEPIEMMLYVRWHGPSGQTKVNRLCLKSIQSHDALEVRGGGGPVRGEGRKGPQVVDALSLSFQTRRAQRPRTLGGYALAFVKPPCNSCHAVARAWPFPERLICPRRCPDARARAPPPPPPNPHPHHPLHNTKQGLPQQLIKGAYPEHAAMPSYMTSEEYLKFTPTRDYLALPGALCCAV